MRSDFLATPFPKLVGRYAHIPIKSLCGVFDTPLNGVWDTVSLQICDLITAWKIDWSSINPAHFFTHRIPGEEEKGSLSPAVDMPNLPCARSTGKGSTLGLLTKRRRVRAGPALRRDELELPESETSAVSNGASPLWPENARKHWKVGKAEKRTRPLL